MTNHYNNLWVEKYRPKILDEVILDNEIKSYFESITDDIPNLLFYGSPGTGKSTLTKIIVNNLLKCQYLYINASDENGIDTIRNKVISFAQTRSLDSKKKCIILEEADGLTGESLRILRNVMEEYVDTTRFILTANYINKIIEPIRSRCVLFKLQFTARNCADRCFEILKKEGIKLNTELLTNRFPAFLNERFPDFRRIINDLQKFSTTGTLIFPDKDETTDLINEIVDGLCKKTKTSLEIRKLVINSEKTFSNDYQQLLKSMFDAIYSKNSIDNNLKKGLLTDVGEYLYRDNLVMDHEINFFCCVLQLEKTISS